MKSEDKNCLHQHYFTIITKIQQNRKKLYFGRWTQSALLCTKLSIIVDMSIIFFNTDSIIILHPVQPLDVTGVPSGHMSHLSPTIPGLQIHLPLICSQFVLMEPKGEQTHAEKDTAKFFTKN